MVVAAFQILPMYDERRPVTPRRATNTMPIVHVGFSAGVDAFIAFQPAKEANPSGTPWSSRSRGRPGNRDEEANVSGADPPAARGYEVRQDTVRVEAEVG